MFQTNTPDALKYASWTVYGDEDKDVIIKDFLQRWKGLTPDILAHVFQETKEDRHDKLFVLSALGYLAPPEAHALLLPFVHSHKRSERWISTLSLGQLKELMVFPLLQHMLLEELLNPKALENEAFDDYDWYMSRRLEIATLLGNWGNTDAIASLCEALRQCWAMAANPDVYFGDSPSSMYWYYTYYLGWWSPFMNSLAYALGRLDAQEVLEMLTLPPAHLHIAKLYFVYGALKEIKGKNLLQERWSRIFIERLVVQQTDGAIRTRYYPLDQVMQTLQRCFHLSTEEQTAFLHQTLIAYRQTMYEYYPRNSPDYEERFCSPDLGDLGPFIY